MEKWDVTFAISVATIILLLLLSFLLFFFVQYRVKSNRFIKEKEVMKKNFDEMLLQSQIEVQETTSSYLAKELHDNVGQMLSSSKMLLWVTQKNLEKIPDTLIIAQETLATAINELRSLSKSLDKDWLSQFDLVDNLNTEIKRINSGLALHIAFSHSGKIPFNAEEQIILFRIMQEALQNAIKHSEAKNIQIAIEVKDDNLILKLEDDGKGIDEQSEGGLGIRNMKHRTKLLGGNINWASLEKGTVVTIRLPIKKDKE